MSSFADIICETCWAYKNYSIEGGKAVCDHCDGSCLIEDYPNIKHQLPGCLQELSFGNFTVVQRFCLCRLEPQDLSLKVYKQTTDQNL